MKNESDNTTETKHVGEYPVRDSAMTPDTTGATGGRHVIQRSRISGNWHVERDGKHVATVFTESDAKRFVAGDAAIEACRLFIERYDMNPFMPPPDDAQDKFNKLVNLARSALAKAKGGDGE